MLLGATSRVKRVGRRLALDTCIGKG